MLLGAVLLDELFVFGETGRAEMGPEGVHSSGILICLFLGVDNMYGGLGTPGILELEEVGEGGVLGSYFPEIGDF